MTEVAFEHVTKVFPGETVAVDDLTLVAGDGEFLILVGPSGCGKTTALRLVAGLEKVTSGTIRIGERTVNDVSPRDRDIAMVFQNYALYPHMNVEKNLAFGLRQRRVHRDEIDRRVRDTADVLGLGDLLKRKPGQLSGGQRQRVAMGRALVREPKAFLLDEPLSNLDAKLRVEMRAELKRLHQRLGITTIYVTHDQTEAMTLGDRIVVMSEGKVRQIGAPQDVYDRPADVFVAGFIGSPPMNLLRGTAADGRITAGELEFERPGAPQGEVIVGVRPEALRPRMEGRPGLDVQADVVEPLGDELVVHGSIAGRLAEAETGQDLQPAAPGSRAPIVARLAPHERVAPGDTIRLFVDPETVHLFDAPTGGAIEG